ncbi:hypothetical protein [Staphylococcus phage vB_StaM_SA1]|nr:hypothetical protein [Staphylococcus phage vB_StaM_SA1]
MDKENMYKVKGKQELVEFNKDKYINEDEYRFKMIADVLKRFYVKDTRLNVPFTKILNLPKSILKLKLSYIEMEYKQTTIYKSPNLMQTWSEIIFYFNERNNDHYIDILYNYYDKNNNEIEIIDNGNKLRIMYLHEEPKDNMKVSEIIISNFLNKFLLNLKRFDDYVDLEVLLNNKFHSIDDVNMLNEDLFAPATDKDIKNYLINKNFS